MLLSFKCQMRTEDGIERWGGIIPRFESHGSHYEIRIESRSGIMVVFGKTARGWFACMPDQGAGCHLSDFKDRFWNTESLSSVLGEVDAVTVAQALFVLADKIHI